MPTHPEIQHTPETLALTIGQVWQNGNVISENGLFLTSHIAQGKTVIFPESRQEVQVASVTTVIGGAPLLDLHDFLKKDNQNGFPNLYLIIDPANPKIATEIMTALASQDATVLDSTIKMVIRNFLGDIIDDKKSLEALRTAYFDLGANLGDNFIHLLPFDIEHLSGLIDSRVIDRIVCLHPPIALPIPSIIDWAARVLTPHGSLIIQSENTDIKLMATSTVQKHPALQGPFIHPPYTSVYSIAYAHAQGKTEALEIKLAS